MYRKMLDARNVDILYIIFAYICVNLILQNLEILLFEILLPNKIKSNNASSKKKKKKMDNDVSIMNDKSNDGCKPFNFPKLPNNEVHTARIKRKKEHGIRYPIFLATQRKRVGIRISFDPFLGLGYKMDIFQCA